MRFIDQLPENPDPEQYGVYPLSVRYTYGGIAFMARLPERDLLIASSGFGFSGSGFAAGNRSWTAAELTHENAAVLRRVFSDTAPTAVLRRDRTVGVGDRLGIAAPGHIRVFRRYDAVPILAQQSIRELTLTGRTFENVLDSASWGVFREGYTGSFGADGDHLKTPAEVRLALSCGCTMITLDCSEHIHSEAAAMTDAAVAQAYHPDVVLEKKYLGKTFRVGETKVSFSEAAFRRMSLIYNEAITFAVSIYQEFFAGQDERLDFELSIDETSTPTDPAQHYYIARELLDRGVCLATIAPRFCGEFQKGIDYIGDLGQFEQEFAQHAEIARHFGYKLSIHSGSDKFAVFPIIGRYTQGRFHLKTAGTNWLEAMAIIAEHDPALYREVHAYALTTAFAEARKYYHVTTDLAKIPPLGALSDADLPSLLTQNDARQLIHITYGLILNAKNPDGSDRFRTRLYADWRKYEEEYDRRLDAHIGRHLSALYSGFPTQSCQEESL